MMESREMKPWNEENVFGRMRAIYGASMKPNVLVRLREMIEAARSTMTQPSHCDRGRLDEGSAILIAYGNQVCMQDVTPLGALTDFLKETVDGAISHVHVLPFFPFSSDDGFSIIDYEAVDSELGSWDDIRHLSGQFGLMADLVLNHISAESSWFKAFLAGDKAYEDFFITMPEDADLSHVVRPRTTPLLTRFQSTNGEVMVWTTFSRDQIDLNYANPEVLLRMVKILLNYVAHGITVIRLDAVAFLWKEPGTSCSHLAQTHAIVQLLRAILDVVAPDVLLVSETNVPHAENITYFGNGENEAQLVYQFPLPPLVLSAFQQSNADPLSTWLDSIEPPPGNGMFFNFLASHDGIGLRPAEGILSQSQVQELVEQTLAHGAHVSYRTSDDGSDVPYELNISYFDALSDPGKRHELDKQVNRFLTAHAMMLCLAGVPGIYFHSFFGSRSWHEGVARTGVNRAINRKKLERTELLQTLAKPDSIERLVFDGFCHLLRVRGSYEAFHPMSPQSIVPLDSRVFVVRRGDPVECNSICCLHNVTEETIQIDVELEAFGFQGVAEVADVLSCETYAIEDAETLSIQLAPLQAVWLTRQVA